MYFRIYFFLFNKGDSQTFKRKKKRKIRYKVLKIGGEGDESNKRIKEMTFTISSHFLLFRIKQRHRGPNIGIDIPQFILFTGSSFICMICTPQNSLPQKGESLYCASKRNAFPSYMQRRPALNNGDPTP